MDYNATNVNVSMTLVDSAAGERVLSGTVYDDDAVEPLLECFILTVRLTAEANDAFGAAITVVNGTQECCIMDDDGSSS